MKKPNELQWCVSYRKATKDHDLDFVLPGGLIGIIGPHASFDASLDALRRRVTNELCVLAMEKNPMDFLGACLLHGDWAQVKLWPGQVALIRRCGAAYGTLPALSPSGLAKATGLSRQAVHAKMQSGILTAITLPLGQKVIPLDTLPEDLLARLQKEQNNG